MTKTANTKLHYKMYKCGKSWAFAGIASVGLFLTLGSTTVQADTTTGSTTSSEINTDPSATATPQSNVVTLPKSSTSTPETPAPTVNSTEDPQATTSEEPAQPESTPPETVNAPASQPQPAKPTKPLHTPTPQTPPVTSPAPKTSEATTPKPVSAPVAPVTAARSLAAPVDAAIDTWMPNKTLQTMVAKSMGIDVSQITQENIATELTHLETGHAIGDTVFVDGKTPFSLEGLQYATNLTTLDLSYDNGVEYLILGNSPRGLSGSLGDIVDLSPLRKLENLTTLNVAHNKIVSLEPLANLKKLTNLNVTYNNIGDFSMLDAQQFTSLKISHQVFILDYAQQKFVDPTTHTITVPALLRLPQNGNLTVDKPFLINSENFELVETLLQEIHTPSSLGEQVYSLYYSGMTPDDYKINPDGSMTFSNISPQQIYYYSGTYATYPNSVGTATPGNHKYYLRADLWSNKLDSFTILIPYANATAAAPVTVQYRDTANDTTPIKPDLVFGTAQMAGDTYTLTPEQLAVEGYTYDDTRNQNAAITGTLSDQAQTITLYYTKDATKPVTPVTPPVTPATTVTVTVHYRDDQGEQLLPDAQLTGQPGTAYQVNTPVIKGYQLDTANTATGTFGDRDQDIVVTYHATASNGHGATITPGTDTARQPDLVTPDKPQATSVNVTTHGQAAKLSPKKAQRVAGTRTTPSRQTTPANLTAKQTLPQTNTHRTSPIAGLALLLGTLIGFGWYRKRNEH